MYEGAADIPLSLLKKIILSQLIINFALEYRKCILVYATNIFWLYVKRQEELYSVGLVKFPPTVFGMQEGYQNRHFSVRFYLQIKLCRLICFLVP